MTNQDQAVAKIQDALILIANYLKQQDAQGPLILKLIPKQKIDEGLICWALLRMGKDFLRYIELGLDLFLLELVAYTIANGGDVARAVAKSTFVIPLHVKNNTTLPFRFQKVEGGVYPTIFGLLDLPKALDEYQSVLERIKNIRKQSFRNPAAHLLALKDILPGVPDDRVKKYPSMKASDIACDYLNIRYGLSVNRESIKKSLKLAREPVKTFLQTIAKALVRSREPARKFVRSLKESPDWPDFQALLAKR